MREEFLSELVEAISNWPEVVAIAEGGSQAMGNQDGLAGVTERNAELGITLLLAAQYDQFDFSAIGFVFHLVHDGQGSGTRTDNQPPALPGYVLLD